MVFRAEFNIMLVRVLNREDPDQKQSYLGLPCLSRPFWQATSVRTFRIFVLEAYKTADDKSRRLLYCCDWRFKG